MDWHSTTAEIGMSFACIFAGLGILKDMDTADFLVMAFGTLTFYIAGILIATAVREAIEYFVKYYVRMTNHD